MDSGDHGSPRLFNTFGVDQTLEQLVAGIISGVGKDGDEAVVSCLERIDKVALSKNQLVVSTDEMEQAKEQVSPELESALQLMARRIRLYAEKMMPKKVSWFEDEGGHES